MFKAENRRENTFQLWGWILFVVSAGFFIASSIRSGDMIGIWGGFFFLLACIAFLVPAMTARSRGDDD